MLDHLLIPQILKTICKSFQDAGSLFSFSQKQTTGIRGDISSIEFGYYFSLT